MSSSAETRVILNNYYDALLKKEGWQSVLSEDVLLTGTDVKESKGKALFVNNDFFKMIRSLKVEQMIVENDNACALVRYDLVSASQSKSLKSGESKEKNLALTPFTLIRPHSNGP